jgi:hypothetical protein
VLASIAASAAAARAIGYAGLGDLIEAEQLNPARIAFIFQFSASKRAARDCSLLLLAGAFGRYRACSQDWDGEEERRLCLEALAGEPDPKAALAKLSQEARHIDEQSRLEALQNMPARPAETFTAHIVEMIVTGMDSYRKPTAPPRGREVERQSCAD